MSKKINFRNLDAVAKKNAQASEERERKYAQEQRENRKKSVNTDCEIDPFLAYLIYETLTNHNH